MEDLARKVAIRDLSDIIQNLNEIGGSDNIEDYIATLKEMRDIINLNLKSALENK